MKIGKFNAIALISSDEPLIKAIHVPTHSECIVFDEKGFCVNGYSENKLLSFIEGRENITSSSGRIFVFNDELPENRASIEEIENFLNLMKNE